MEQDEDAQKKKKAAQKALQEMVKEKAVLEARLEEQSKFGEERKEGTKGIAQAWSAAQEKVQEAEKAHADEVRTLQEQLEAQNKKVTEQALQEAMLKGGFAVLASQQGKVDDAQSLLTGEKQANIACAMGGTWSEQGRA